MATIYTVRPAYLVRDAEQIERDAEQSLRAWILLGQSERYGDAMRTAIVETLGEEALRYVPRS